MALLVSGNCSVSSRSRAEEAGSGLLGPARGQTVSELQVKRRRPSLKDAPHARMGRVCRQCQGPEGGSHWLRAGDGAGRAQYKGGGVRAPCQFRSPWRLTSVRRRPGRASAQGSFPPLPTRRPAARSSPRPFLPFLRGP